MQKSILFSSSLIARLQNCSNAEPLLFKKNQTVFAREIFERSIHLASNLDRLGLSKNNRIVIAIQPGIEFLIVIYANMLLRTRVSIIDPEMGQELYNQKLTQWDPSYAFVDSRLLLLNEYPFLKRIYQKLKKSSLTFPLLKEVRHISVGLNLPFRLEHDKFKKLMRKNHLPSELVIDDSNHDFLVTYTSGTTSVPKGVLHSFEGLECSFQHIVNLLGDPAGQRLANHLPHFMLIGINAGIPVYLWNYSSNPNEKLKFITKHQITTLFGPPSDYLELIAHCKVTGKKLPTCLQHIIIGSAPVYKAFLTLLVNYLPKHTRISAFYGMTENLVVAHMDGREKLNYESEGDPVGKPVEGVDIKIAKDGEIHIKSPQLFSRYWHLNDRPEWHATGDLGYVDKNGYLIMTGRKKDMILRRNQNIYPGLYEPTIHRIPGVISAAMVGVYSESLFDEEVFLIIETDESLKVGNIMKLLEQGEFSIDREALPDFIKFMPIPRKGRQHKIDKEKLRTLLSYTRKEKT